MSCPKCFHLSDGDLSDHFAISSTGGEVVIHTSRYGQLHKSRGKSTTSRVMWCRQAKRCRPQRFPVTAATVSLRGLFIPLLMFFHVIDRRSFLLLLLLLLQLPPFFFFLMIHVNGNRRQVPSATFRRQQLDQLQAMETLSNTFLFAGPNRNVRRK